MSRRRGASERAECICADCVGPDGTGRCPNLGHLAELARATRRVSRTRERRSAEQAPCVQADTGAVRETRGFTPNSSVSAQLRSGPRLAIRPFIMIWIALLPSLVATWLFVGTLKLRGAKAR